MSSHLHSHFLAWVLGITPRSFCLCNKHLCNELISPAPEWIFHLFGKSTVGTTLKSSIQTTPSNSTRRNPLALHIRAKISRDAEVISKLCDPGDTVLADEEERQGRNGRERDTGKFRGFCSLWDNSYLRLKYPLWGFKYMSTKWPHWCQSGKHGSIWVTLHDVAAKGINITCFRQGKERLQPESHFFRYSFSGTN